MARPDERDLLQLGPWPLGLNNLDREDSLPRGQLRVGTNIDIYSNGKVRSRPGATLRDATAAGGNSLWGNKLIALYRLDDALYRFVPGQPAGAPLITGLNEASDMVFHTVGSLVYVSDGYFAHRIDPYALTAAPWGVASPDWQPTLTANAAGALDAGAYQVAATFMTASGEESGTIIAGVVDLPNGGDIDLTNIPQPYEPHVTHINFYVTTANGTVLSWHSRVPVGTTSHTIGRQQLGRRLETQFLMSMTAGQCAGFHNGVFYVGDGNMLKWSPPNNYGQWDARTDYLEFEHDIDTISSAGPASGGGGLFVSAGRETYYLPGDQPKDFKQVDAACGAQRGSGEHIPGDSFGMEGMPSYAVPVWVDLDGMFCIGLADGSIIRPTKSRFAMGLGDTAVTFVRSLRGVHQYVIGMPGPAMNSKATFTDSADMVLIRRSPAC